MTGLNLAPDWTDERVELMKKLDAAGMSRGQIAKQLGGVSRNAVTGKLHRLGLIKPGERKPSEPKRLDNRPSAAYRKPSAPPVKKMSSGKSGSIQARANGQLNGAAPRPLVERQEQPGHATMTTLGAHMCKWPIGDPQADSFTFCGAGRDGERAYCSRHSAIAYRPFQKKPSDGLGKLRVRG